MAQNREFTISNIAKFDHPWAIEFLPNEKILLTEMRGSLKLLDNKGVFLEEVKAFLRSLLEAKVDLAISHFIQPSKKTGSFT